MSRYLIETSVVDGYLLEDGTGVLLLEGTDSGSFSRNITMVGVG